MLLTCVLPVRFGRLRSVCIWGGWDRGEGEGDGDRGEGEGDEDREGAGGRGKRRRGRSATPGMGAHKHFSQRDQSVHGGLSWEAELPLGSWKSVGQRVWNGGQQTYRRLGDRAGMDLARPVSHDLQKA